MNFNEMIWQAVKLGDGTYVWQDGKLIPAKKNEDADIEIEPEIEVEIPDDEIPFCGMDCDNCPDYDAMEDGDDFDDDESLCWGVPDIENIIFNPPATIVFWTDGTKTVVKCMEGQPYERYAGFAAACMKKLFGSTSRAKAIMEECDQANWIQPKPEPKKGLTPKEFIDALVKIFGKELDAAEKKAQEEKGDGTPQT